MAQEPRREWFEKDYYADLGVPKNASDAEIKKAYRKLAQQHHPDTKQGDPSAEERFKEISSAYDVLGDPEKRKAYDQVRDMSASGAQQRVRAAQEHPLAAADRSRDRRVGDTGQQGRAQKMLVHVSLPVAAERQ